MCCKLKLCLRMLSLRKQMHGVSFHTVEWLYLAWSLAPHCGAVVLTSTLMPHSQATQHPNNFTSIFLWYKPRKLTVPFSIILHQVFRAIKSAHLPLSSSHLFLPNFNLLLLLVSIPVFQSLHSLRLPGISILFFQNLNSFLLPVISIFLFLNLNYLLPCLLILFQNLYFLSVVFFIVLLILSVTSFLDASTTTFLFFKYSLRSISAKCRKIQLLHNAHAHRVLLLLKN